LLLWLCLAIPQVSRGASPAAAREPHVQLRGALYKQGSDRKVKLYTWELTACPHLWTSRYHRLDGALVVEDWTRFEGGRFVAYGYIRPAIGETSSVRVTGAQIQFDFRRGAVRKRETLTTDGVFLTGPAVFAFIHEHVDELRAGKELEIKYGVLDRLDQYTFKLRAERAPGGEADRIQIRAKSLFVRMAIDPLIVTLSKDGRFRGVAGRTIIVEQVDRERVPVDADLWVESESEADCDALPRRDGDQPERADRP
jgi:hypothetical protein